MSPMTLSLEVRTNASCTTGSLMVHQRTTYRPCQILLLFLPNSLHLSLCSPDGEAKIIRYNFSYHLILRRRDSIPRQSVELHQTGTFEGRSICSICSICIKNRSICKNIRSICLHIHRNGLHSYSILTKPNL